MIGVDIEYHNSKRATMLVWESKEGIEDGVLYGYVEKIVDDKVKSKILTSLGITVLILTSLSLSLSSLSGMTIHLLLYQISLWLSPYPSSHSQAMHLHSHQQMQ